MTKLEDIDIADYVPRNLRKLLYLGTGCKKEYKR